MSVWRRLLGKKKDKLEIDEIKVHEIDGHKIKFIKSHSIAGCLYSMVVDGKGHSAGLFHITEEEFKDKMIEILKDEYEITMIRDEIDISWDGTM